MRIADLRLLYDFHYWGTHIILDKCAEVSPGQFDASSPFPGGSLRGTLIHTLGAEIVWLTRFHGASGQFPGPADMPDLSAIRARWTEQERAMRSYLGGLGDADLDRATPYATSDGKAHTNTLWQLLLHVTYHGMQHRAECAQLLTDCGKSPGNIDLIVFLRRQQP